MHYFLDPGSVALTSANYIPKNLSTSALDASNLNSEIIEYSYMQDSGQASNSLTLVPAVDFRAQSPHHLQAASTRLSVSNLIPPRSSSPANFHQSRGSLPCQAAIAGSLMRSRARRLGLKVYGVGPFGSIPVLFSGDWGGTCWRSSQDLTSQ